MNAEEKLKLSYRDIRELASHLQDVREEERAHMAREIHDELGQNYGVKNINETVCSHFPSVFTGNYLYLYQITCCECHEHPEFAAIHIDLCAALERYSFTCKRLR